MPRTSAFEQSQQKAFKQLKAIDNAKLINGNTYRSLYSKIFSASKGKRGDKAITEVVNQLLQIPELSRAASTSMKAPVKVTKSMILNKNFNDNIFKTLTSNVTSGINTTIPIKKMADKSGNNVFKTVLETVQKLNPSLGTKKILINVHPNGRPNEGVHYTLSDSNTANLQEKIQKFLLGDFNFYQEDSFIVFSEMISGAGDSMTVSILGAPSNSNSKNGGAFFKYYTKIDFDLSRYGVFRNFEESDYTHTCLVTALLSGGLSDEKKIKLVNTLKTREIPICKLPEICALIDIQINLKKESDKKNVKKYGNSEEVYNIGLIDDHFFLNDEVELTSFCLNNYHEVKDVENWNHIYKSRNGYFNRDKNRKITSYEAIELLLKNKDLLLEPISFENSDAAKTQYYGQIEQKITNLVDVDMNDKNAIREVKLVDKNPLGKEYVNVFFDFETFSVKGLHTAYLCSYIMEYESKTFKLSFEGDDCARKMLDSIVKNMRDPEKTIRLVAHNAGYDFNFIVRHLYRVKYISRGTHLISASGIYTRFINQNKKLVYNIEVKDSYNMITSPLRDFSGMFKIPCEKEVMPYEIYNIEGNIEKRFVEISQAFEFLKTEEDKTHFVENIEKWNLRKGDKYDIVEYSRIYCEIDCEVLKKGYEKFREWISEVTELNTNDFLTLASLADQYLIKEGCYDGVYELCGIPQMFIQGCVIGGRTMTCDNKKQLFDSNEEGGKMNDFDGVSLYPSAMVRMEGFLKGAPKVIKDLEFESVKNFDGYFVDIVITKVGKDRHFPLASFKSEESGVRDFTNDLVGKEIRVDKVTLEDLIQFQEIEFYILRGYYFNEGFNPKVNDVMTHLFQTRLQKKKEKNPIEVIYKLLMNSAYGKSIMKAIKETIDIVEGEENFKKHMYRNYNWIKEAIPISDSKKYLIKSVKPVHKHFNRPQVGSMVLSWSKRIMNEVMCLADDLNLKIYYQDTDSMHLLDENIPILSNAFKEKYERELIGKNLGQFHSDFKMSCENKTGEIYATKSIFLGKKSYMNVLEAVEEGTGKIINDDHIRMKGIPMTTVKFTAKMHKCSVAELYERLYKGDEIDFDLTESSTRVNFKTSKTFSVSTLEHFTRTLKFDNE
jgi:hypothetical protein